MAEPVPAPGHLDDETSGGRFLQCADELLPCQVNVGPHDDFGLEFHTGDGSHPKHPVGVGTETGQTLADHVADTFGNTEFLRAQPTEPPAVALLQEPRLRQMPEHLADEERVAFRLVVDRLGEQRVIPLQLLPSRFLHECRDRRTVETAQRQACHTVEPAQIGQHFDEWMIVAEFVVPVGAHDQDPAQVSGADDIPQEEQRRLRGPLEVVNSK
jgi:hypothetical protein